MGWRGFFVVLCVVALLSGCAHTKYVAAPEYHTEYRARTDSVLRIDTIMRHDSVSVMMVGDTVRIDRYLWRDNIRYRYVVKSDTILRTDSVRVPYSVERQLTKWERRFMGIGKMAVGGMVVAGIIFIIWLSKRKIP